MLQQQVAPLEATFEKLGDGVDHFVVLGDFNRNLWHEFNRVTGAEAVRSDGQMDLSTVRPVGATTRNMLLELNDGAPASSKAVLLAPACKGNAEIGTACEQQRRTS